jgi:hypothetical protein
VEEEAQRQKIRRVSAWSRLQKVHRMPPSSNESLSAMMVRRLSISDPRYDIKWAYGAFLDGIPRRLGHSDALDTTTRALMITMSLSRDACKSPSLAVLRSYSVAIEATRRALSHPGKAQCMMTMCATYFLLLCQVCAAVTFFYYNTFKQLVSDIVKELHRYARRYRNSCRRNRSPTQHRRFRFRSQGRLPPKYRLGTVQHNCQCFSFPRMGIC